MQSKVTYFLLLLFVLFLIASDATQAGRFANNFFSWLGNGLDAFMEFLDALFGDDGIRSSQAP